MSKPETIDLASALPCHRCEYDVRAQPEDAACPECGASVAESRRIGPLVRRPAWHESDPRWRRRMIAGAWMLAAVPLMSMLKTFGWARAIHTPIFYSAQAGQTLDDSFIVNVDGYLVFCVGVALLFAKERRRRRNPFDWTRRWGVVSSYVILLLGSLGTVYFSALVMTGIAAMFQSCPPQYAPAITPLLARLSTAYLRYGPQPARMADATIACASSTAILFACVSLFEALRSTGRRAATTTLAAIALLPLALAGAAQLVEAIGYGLGAGVELIDFYGRLYFFSPNALARGLVDLSQNGLTRRLVIELCKWFACLAIALWLTGAQIAAYARRRGPAGEAAR